MENKHHSIVIYPLFSRWEQQMVTKSIRQGKRILMGWNNLTVIHK